MGLPRILYDLREVGERAGKDWIAKITKRNRRRDYRHSSVCYIELGAARIACGNRL